MKQSNPAKKGPLARWLARKGPALQAMLRGASYISLMPRLRPRPAPAAPDHYLWEASGYLNSAAKVLIKNYDVAKAKELEALDSDRKDQG